MIGLLRYEWLRFATIRSSWVMLGLPIIVAAAVGWLFGHFSDSMGRGTGVTVDFGVLISVSPVMTLAAVFLTVIAAQSIGQEYRHGVIRVTLTQFPHRNRVLVAKLLLVIVLVAVMAAIVIGVLWGAAAIGIAPSGGSIRYTSSTDGPLIVRALLYVVIFTIIAFAITLLTRVMQLGIILPIVLALLVEPIIRVIVLLATGFNGNGPPTADDGPWILRVLPFSSGQNALDTTGSPWQSMLTFAIWCAAVMIPAWILFLRRDA